MNEADTTLATELVVPSCIVSKLDVSRLVSEIEQIDGELTAIVARAKAGQQQHTVPVISDQLTAFLQANQRTLNDSKARSELIHQMRILKDTAPVIHMTFAVSAEHESLQQLVEWLRQSVHHHVVIEVGLQPALIAGAYVRTPNHVHDLSVRARLADHHDVLVKELEALRANS